MTRARMFTGRSLLGCLDNNRRSALELTAQVKAAKAEAREAQDRAEELRQADAARRGRGRLARLRAAWRGE